MTTMPIIADCPISMLGNLQAPADPRIEKTHMICDGAAVINGIALPERVIEELRQLGIPLAWYSSAELKDAIEACAIDGQLIDDPDGVNFSDKLYLTATERQKKRPSFCTQIDAQRNEEETDIYHALS